MSPSQRVEDNVSAKFRFDELGKPNRKRKRGGSPVAVDGFGIDHGQPGSAVAAATPPVYTAQWLEKYAKQAGFY
jgi:hypothetical protein